MVKRITLNKQTQRFRLYFKYNFLKDKIFFFPFNNYEFDRMSSITPKHNLAFAFGHLQQVTPYVTNNVTQTQ